MITSASYRMPNRRAQWATAFLVIIAIVGVVSVVSDLMERDLIQRMRDGGEVTLQEAEASDDRQAAIAVIQLGLLIVSAITFLMWLYLARLNLDAFGVEGVRFAPRWTWLGFVIPVMNVYRPYQVVAEIWKASNPRARSPAFSAWKHTEVNDIVKVWWGSWLILNAVGRLLRRTYDYTDTIDSLLTSNLLTLVLDIGGVIGAGIAILFVRGLTQRQNQKFKNMTSADMATDQRASESFA
jgi:hypothetical protein